MTPENNQSVNLHNLPEWEKVQDTISHLLPLGKRQLIDVEAYYRARIAYMRGDKSKMEEFNKKMSDERFEKIQPAVIAVREMLTQSPRASHLLRRKR